MTSVLGTVPLEVEVVQHYSVPLVFTASAPSGALSTVRSCVTGWTFVETTGTAPASLQLMDGSSNTGLVFAEIALSPGQSIRDVTGAWPLIVYRGIWVQQLTGSVRGAVWAEPA